MPIKTSHDLRIADSLLAIALLGACVTSHAQQFPTKPVRYVVAFDAGDSPDIVARLAGDRLTRIWDQQVLVENRVGAGGTIAGAFVAKAPEEVIEEQKERRAEAAATATRLQEAIARLST